MADSSRAQLCYLAETTWGVTPVAAMTRMRFTGESLGFQIQNTTSREVRADRQVADLIQTGAEASGSVEVELSYGAHDALLAAALFSAWQAPVIICPSRASITRIRSGEEDAGSDAAAGAGRAKSEATFAVAWKWLTRGDFDLGRSVWPPRATSCPSIQVSITSKLMRSWRRMRSAGSPGRRSPQRSP